VTGSHNSAPQVLCPLITRALPTSIAINKISCESDKLLFFSTTQLHVGKATATLTKHLFEMITDLNLKISRNLTLAIFITCYCQHSMTFVDTLMKRKHNVQCSDS